MTCANDATQLTSVSAMSAAMGCVRIAAELDDEIQLVPGTGWQMMGRPYVIGITGLCELFPEQGFQRSAQIGILEGISACDQLIGLDPLA